MGNRWKPFSVGHFVAHRCDPGKFGEFYIFFLNLTPCMRRPR